LLAIIRTPSYPINCGC